MFKSFKLVCKPINHSGNFSGMNLFAGVNEPPYCWRRRLERTVHLGLGEVRSLGISGDEWEGMKVGL